MESASWGRLDSAATNRPFCADARGPQSRVPPRRAGAADAASRWGAGLVATGAAGRCGHGRRRVGLRHPQGEAVQLED